MQQPLVHNFKTQLASQARLSTSASLPNTVVWEGSGSREPAWLGRLFQTLFQHEVFLFLNYANNERRLAFPVSC